MKILRKEQATTGPRGPVSTASRGAVHLLVGREGEEQALTPVSVTLEVDDVDRAYNDAVALGHLSVYPITDGGPWGVRRFFVADSNGVILNIMCRSNSSPQYASH